VLNMQTAYITHPQCQLHDMGRHHPECPERLQAIQDQLIASGLLGLLSEHEAPAASREQLIRVHDAAYVDEIAAIAPATGTIHVDPDTAMNPHSYRAALHAAGAAILGIDLVLQGQAANAFCCVRPPGHHAEQARAMGFCFFNNVAIGAAHALEHHGLDRVAIVDFDVHHGNGTEDIFRDDPRVLMVSTFQHPFYPYSGIQGRSERMVNIPLPAYSAGPAFRQVVEEHWRPALDRFRPQAIFISAGFDAHRDDDMASLGLVESDYLWVTHQIKEAAVSHAGGRIVSCLEGGYNLSALARSVVAHIKGLADL
jgi:acetoin utilization deacetylase AcuC-like enzyme